MSAVTGDGMVWYCISIFKRVIQQAAKVDFGDDFEDLRHRIAKQETKRMAMARMSVKWLQRSVDYDNQSW